MPQSVIRVSSDRTLQKYRIDACFGEFLSYLRRNHLYDDSIIVLTTDHGDSGEGEWGHGISIFPRLCGFRSSCTSERMKSHVTTDLTRVAFPQTSCRRCMNCSGTRRRTWVRCMEHRCSSLRTDLVPRRTGAFCWHRATRHLGHLRRNGRSLYIADLVNGREYAYDLTSAPIGARTRITDDERRVNQRWIRERIAELARLYRFNPEP